MTADEYKAHVQTILKDLQNKHTKEQPIEIEDCIAGLLPNRRANKRIRDFVVDTLKLEGKDFDTAIRMQTIFRDLGAIPAHATHYVEIMAGKLKITATYGGLLQMHEEPFIARDDGTKDYVSPSLFDQPEFQTLIASKFHRTIGFHEFQNRLRVRARELGLSIKDTAINDASEKWYSDVCLDRLWQIQGDIAFCESEDVRENGARSLQELVKKCFEWESEDDIGFYVAAFQKFIHSVKRKILGLPVYDHLMLVILNTIQGNGKSTLVEKFLEPVVEITTPCDFAMLTEDRQIDMWKNYVGVMDEMKGAKKADMEATKHAITAATMARRPMRTNTNTIVENKMTFIGTANVDGIGDLIRDTTGTRRFMGLKTKERMDWDLINNTDWRDVWQSVDERGPCPMKPFKAKLADVQELDRTITPFEAWIASLDGDTYLQNEGTKAQSDGAHTMTTLRKGAAHTSGDLYLHYSEYAQKFFPDEVRKGPVNVWQFGHRMKAHCAAKDARFDREKGRDGYLHVWKG